MNTNPIRTALLLLMAFQAAVVGVFWAWEFSLPHQAETVESAVLTTVLWSKSGLPLYSHPTGLPLIQNPYGPVFELLCTWLPMKHTQPYFVGRTISLLALLGIGMVVTYWLRSQQVRWSFILLAGLLLLTSKPWILFGPLYRVDTLAIFLSLLGFTFVLVKRRAATVWALLIFTLAINVKLTAVAAPVATAFHLWTTDRRRATWFLAGLLLLLPGSVLTLQWMTDGAYLFNASIGNVPSHWLKGIELPSRILLSLFWLTAAVLAIRQVRIPTGSSTRAVLIYAMTSLVIASLFATNPLSSWNYLMEFYVALGILTGILLTRLEQQSTPPRVRKRILAMLTAHAVVNLLIATQTAWATSREILDYEARYNHAYARLAPYARSGRTVVVLESPEGKDALNALGRPNSISLPASVERQPEIQQLIRRSLAQGDVDVVLTGPRLELRE